MPNVTNVRVRAAEILGQFKGGGRSPEESLTDAKRAILHDGHFRAGINLTRWLEQQDPSEEYPTSDPLHEMDAFERQLYFCGIRTQSDPVKGLFADTVERFYLSDSPASPILFPEFINRQIRVPLIAPPILDDLIAITTPVDSDSYRTIYLADNVDQRQMRRIGEGGELPRVKLTTSEKAITLHKYGVMLEGSYEVFRRLRIDMFALHLSRIALQAMLDKSAEALSVAINGDGNGNAAVNYNLAGQLDTGTTPGNLTYKAWLRWQLKPFPYQIDTVVAGEAETLTILTLQFPNINPMMLLAMLTEGHPATNQVELAPRLWGNIRLVFFPYAAPANVLTGIQKGTALEMIQEVGSSLTETDRIINKQLNEIAISEVVGFGQIIGQAIETLTLNA